jgi:putative Holliday junction resolvase
MEWSTLAGKFFLGNLFLLTLTCYDMGMKYLSIDYGAKKVGIATSDDEGRMAYPCMISENNTSLMSDIKEIVKAMNIKEIVIGESIDQNGKPNPIMKDIRAFAVRLEDELDLPVHFEKEFMTSLEARRFQGQHIVDDSAAALILQRYLDRVNKVVAGVDDQVSEDEEE